MARGASIRRCIPVLTCAALIAAGCGSSGSSESTGASGSSSTTSAKPADTKQLTFNTWGGAYQQAQMKAIVGPYQSSTGTKVTVTQPIDYAKLKTMVKTGNVVWDVADVEPYV